MEENVKFFDTQQSLNCFPELRIEVILVSLRYLRLRLQSDQFGHNQCILFILTQLIFNDHIQLVKIRKVNFMRFLIMRIDQKNEIEIRFEERIRHLAVRRLVQREHLFQLVKYTINPLPIPFRKQLVERPENFQAFLQRLKE